MRALYTPAKYDAGTDLGIGVNASTKCRSVRQQGDGRAVRRARHYPAFAVLQAL